MAQYYQDPKWDPRFGIVNYLEGSTVQHLILLCPEPGPINSITMQSFLFYHTRGGRREIVKAPMRCDTSNDLPRVNNRDYSSSVGAKRRIHLTILSRRLILFTVGLYRSMVFFFYEVENLRRPVSPGDGQKEGNG